MSCPPKTDTSMESPPSSPKRLKLGRWLMLLSAITVALGGFVWWKSQSERLQFVETIWSDSLAGHEHESAEQRRKIGELWSLSRSTELMLFGRGLRRDFAQQYVAFASANSFLQAVSDQLLAESRENAGEFFHFEWSTWWDSVMQPRVGDSWDMNVETQVLVATEQVVSLFQESESFTGGAHTNHSRTTRNFVNRGGTPHELKLEELFIGTQWVHELSELCLQDLHRQVASDVAEYPSGKLGFDDLRSFVMTRDGLTICFRYSVASDAVAEEEVEALIPWEKLAKHLKPDGPHRLLQSKVSE